MSWFVKLKEGLTKTSEKFSEGLKSILTDRKLDDETLADLEDLLIASDFGPEIAAQFIAELRKLKFGENISEEQVKAVLAEMVEKSFNKIDPPIVIDASKKPFVILMLGVNGTGKTTTIGKLAYHYKNQGKKIMIAAADTFRAAAIEQLEIWADLSGSTFYKKSSGSDAASLAYEAYEKAKEEGYDLLFIDTAGRLHNKKPLMDELEKINRVLKKVNADAPHLSLLTIDATTGQNAYNQLEEFHKIVPIGGLVVTKLDGSSKGGVLVGLCSAFKIPIWAIGVGEKHDDLKPFDAKSYSRSLLGLETE